MKVRIVLEGHRDQEIVRTLLPKDVQAASSIFVMESRSNISSIARTLLVKHREPVAVLMDTDSLEAETIREKYLTTEYLLQAVSGGIPFKVILCIPEIEIIFFNAPEILERIFPEVDLVSYIPFSKSQPKEALDFLFGQGGGPKNLFQFLDALTEVDVERLRATGPIRELILFVNEVVEPIGKPGAT